jgi:integrase
MKVLTSEQASKILNINLTTLNELVKNKRIPHNRISAGNNIIIEFDLPAIENWLTKGLTIVEEKKYLERLKKRFNQKYPESLEILKNYDKQFKEPRKAKGYNLVKVRNKKLGFVYYVRYIVNGKMVRSNWCTHTNNYEAAVRFALDNKDRLLDHYYNRSQKQFSFYSIFKSYYSKDSTYLQIDIKRGRTIGEGARTAYNNFINKQFIPYLRKYKIKNIEENSTPFLSKFQNYLLIDSNKKAGIKPQTINHYISYISKIFDHLLTEGYIKTNPCKSLITIKIKKSDVKITGCFDVTKLKGVFNKRWKNELPYLLSLIIYTTNMRNGEIEKIQVEDFFKIRDYHFLNIPESKSENGERDVPIHDFVYRKIMLYVKKNNFKGGDYIFKLPKCKRLGSKRYKAAYTELAGYIGYDEEKMQKENIRFYSGRHFWKTLMNSENLGDVEEFFMGHKVSDDVAKRYNHRDKQGEKKLLEKTKKVFQILGAHK